jgi:hypothetical protein
MRRQARYNTPAYQQMLDRRAQEDAAPRLREEVPRLRTLQLELSTRREGNLLPESVYIRHVMVDSAPALVWIRCGDPRCNDGHDLTDGILRALRNNEARFTGSSPCGGQTGGAMCARVLHFTAVATYE